MSESKQELASAPRINEALSEKVIAEVDLCYTLGIERRALDALRAKGFPAVYLNRNSRVYLLDEVLQWLTANRGARYVKDKV